MVYVMKSNEHSFHVLLDVHTFTDLCCIPSLLYSFKTKDPFKLKPKLGNHSYSPPEFYFKLYCNLLEMGWPEPHTLFHILMYCRYAWVVSQSFWRKPHSVFICYPDSSGSTMALSNWISREYWKKKGLKIWNEKEVEAQKDCQCHLMLD